MNDGSGRGILAALARQIGAFLGVGFVATALHYLVLVALVQIGGASPVPAALLGFVAGGILSYVLNRKHTYLSDRPHGEAAWRFASVAGVAFLLTYVLMRQFVEAWQVPYLLAQAVTTCLVMVWTFLANLLWTFRKAV